MSPNHEITGKAGSDLKFPTRTEVLQTTLSAATQLFAVWFVFKGMDEMFAPVNSRSAFAFAKVVSLLNRRNKFLLDSDQVSI
jgi:hypothetical protein